MQQKVQKIFFVLEIMAFERFAVSYLYYEVNSYDPQLTSH